MTKHEDIQKELKKIAKKRGGVLYPADVIEYAKNENTALHSQFEWDDGKAAHAHRLQQARQIIRVCLTVIEPAQQESRLFVSMPDDRKEAGGYRFMVDVLSDADQRRELLKEANRNFQMWKRKYQELRELAPVFEAMDKIIEENGVEAVVVELPEPVAA